MFLLSGRVHVMDGSGTPVTLQVNVVESVSFIVILWGASVMVAGSVEKEKHRQICSRCSSHS